MDNLKFVVVICRHGDRTPLHTYPNDPYTVDQHFPFSRGELTNIGKRRMYKLGQKLRKRYDEFLGNVYLPENLKIISSDMNRTKMTAQLVCAGLFPPHDIQRWNENLNWQPIPYSYSTKTDKMLISPTHRCDKFRKQVREVVASEHGIALHKKFESKLKYMGEKTGMLPFRIQEAFYLSMTLAAEESLGLELPEWTQEVYPDPLDQIASYQYLLENHTLFMKQQTNGALLADILQDFDKIITDKSKLKFVLYSGHECTIADLLIALNVFDLKIPKFGSYITLELHECNKEHYLKIYYNNSDEEKLLKIPDLEESCLYSDFRNYVSKYLIPPEIN